MTFEQKLQQSLFHSDVKLGALLPHQAQIKRTAFRQCVRKLKVTASVKDVDDYFATLSPAAVTSGVVPASTLKATLKRLRDDDGALESAAEAQQAKVTWLREQGQQVLDAADATAALEAAEAHLASQAAPAIAQLGAIIKKRNIRLGELTASWQTLDAPKFAKHVSELGVTSPVDEVYALFSSLDEDGGGTLDPTELKHGLKKLLEAASKSESADGASKKKLERLRIAAVKQQEGVKSLERARAWAARAEEEAREKAAALKAQQAMTEAVKNERAKEAAEAKRQADKAAMAAMVQAARAAAAPAAAREKSSPKYELRWRGVGERRYLDPWSPVLSEQDDRKAVPPRVPQLANVVEVDSGCRGRMMQRSQLEDPLAAHRAAGHWAPAAAPTVEVLVV